MTVHERREAVPAPRRRAGLSLVEVLVALAVVAVVALALVGLQVTSLRAARTAAQTRMQAAALDLEADMARLVQPTTGACSGYSTGTGCRPSIPLIRSFRRVPSAVRCSTTVRTLRICASPTAPCSSVMR